MNTLLLIGGMILVFSALVLINKFLGESGVIGFMGFATILANIMICKSVDLFRELLHSFKLIHCFHPSS